jgi:hypothetical protein
MHEVVESLRAPPDHPLNVWFEPWADGLTLPPGTMLELRAAANREGRLEIVRQEQGVAVYSWPGSTLRVFVAEELVRDFSMPVPDIPVGMDMKGFVGLLFGPAPTAGEPSHPQPPPWKPWWRFWER